MYARWQDAQTEKMGLLALTRSPIGQSYLDRLQYSINAQHHPNERMVDGAFRFIQEQTLMQADAVYVSANVTDVIDAARETFKPEPVLPTDLFTPCGFMLLPRSIELPDAAVNDTDVVPIRAIGWMPIRLGAGSSTEDMSSGGLAISYYGHVDDEVNDRTQISPHSKLLLTHQWVIEYNRRTFEEDLGSEDANQRGHAQWALVQTAWRIANQVVSVKERLPRPLRRDVKRRGMDDEAVTVITLRKGSQSYDEAGEGEGPKVQFMVRGHWRNQWYPSIKQHRQIWIDGYWKGPEGAPIRITERVFEFVR